MIYKNVIRPILFSLDAEEAHDITHDFAVSIVDNDTVLSSMNWMFNYGHPGLCQNVCGVNFKNPVGLAAGFDKNGKISNVIEALGFGFTEIGSITAKASVGNPKPRLFRLPEDEGLINRMGLNNDGAQIITKRITSLPRPSIPIGINIAKTHNPAILGDAAIDDYVISFKLAESVADYITINISCPNTEEGKTFEDPDALRELLQAIYAVKNKIKSVPVFVKLSADLSDKDLNRLTEICEHQGIDGYVVVNTSSRRDFLDNTSPFLLENIGRGGLSGRPLLTKSTRIVKRIAELTSYTKPIVAVGGIHSVESAIHLLLSGAWLLQVYTGLIYEGISLPRRINKGISRYMTKKGLTGIRELHGLNEVTLNIRQG